MSARNESPWRMKTTMQRRFVGRDARQRLRPIPFSLSDRLSGPAPVGRAEPRAATRKAGNQA